MLQEYRIDFVSSASGQSHYLAPPIVGGSEFVVQDAQLVLEGDPGDSIGVTLYKSSTEIGSFSPGASVSAGDVVSYSKDSSNGSTKFALASSAVLKVVTAQASSATTATLSVYWDEFART